jgi:hypothetical protein
MSAAFKPLLILLAVSLATPTLAHEEGNEGIPQLGIEADSSVRETPKIDRGSNASTGVLRRQLNRTRDEPAHAPYNAHCHKTIYIGGVPYLVHC